MKDLRALIATEPRARRLLAAHAQSAFGTGAAYVALLVVAFDRFHSPFAVSAILLCGAFAGLALVGSFEATVVFALLAGAGQAAFQPAVMASLPTLVDRERLSTATGVYGAIQELGYTAG